MNQDNHSQRSYNLNPIIRWWPRSYASDQISLFPTFAKKATYSPEPASTRLAEPVTVPLWDGISLPFASKTSCFRFTVQD